MKETPILFSSEMVRAILDGRKSQTRRVINPQPKTIIKDPRNRLPEAFWVDGGKWIKCPYGQPGDRLWVRETWYYEEHMHDLTAGEPDLPGGRYSRRCVYRSDSPSYPVDVGVGEHGWKPSIHMPRWASRITLEIDEIRVERLRDITEADATNEGFKAGYSSFGDGKFEDVLEHERTAKEEFRDLWNSIYSKRGYGWEANPLVWVIKFHRLEDFENEN